LQRLRLFDGRKSVAFYRGQVARVVSLGANDPQKCVAWRDFDASSTAPN